MSLIDLFFIDSIKDIDCHGTLPRIADHDIPTRITQDTMSLIDLFSMNNIKNINCHRSLTRIADQDGAVLY